MRVLIHNDGKEKSQSFEAYLECMSVYGYGPDEDIAIAELAKNVKELIAKLDDVDYRDICYVDCAGNSVK